MKNLIFGILAILLVVITSSCPADEIEVNENAQDIEQPVYEIDPSKIKPPTGG